MPAKPPSSPEDEGVGGLASDLTDPHRHRGALKLIADGLRAGWLQPWKLDPQMAEVLPRLMWESVERSSENEDDRALVRGATVILAMQKANLDLCRVVDEHQRLEAGEATAITRQDVTLHLEFDSPPGVETHRLNGHKPP